MLVGTLAMVWMPPVRQSRSASSAAPLRFDLGPLAAPGFWLVVVAILVAALGLSMAVTSIAARAQTQGFPGAAGYIEAAIAMGSVAGGLLWGRRRHTRSHSTHLAGLIAVLAIGITVCAAVTSLATLGTLMAVTGLAIAPIFVVSYLAADELAPQHQQTEASTWVNTANNIGTAAGASVAGLLIDHLSTSAGFAVCGVILGGTSVLIWLTHRGIEPKNKHLRSCMTSASAADRQTATQTRARAAMRAGDGACENKAGSRRAPALNSCSGSDAGSPDGPQEKSSSSYRGDLPMIHRRAPTHRDSGPATGLVSGLRSESVLSDRQRMLSVPRPAVLRQSK
jgi:hypothetical protein